MGKNPKVEQLPFEISDFDWVISDSHFQHQNIVKYCFRPGYKKNGHHDYFFHNDLMRKNWFKAVQPHETILHLGDLCFWGKDAEKQDRARQTMIDLPGKKFLIKGNHDLYRDDWYEEVGFQILQPFSIQHEEFEVCFSHYPIRDLRKDQISVHGHLHNNSCDGLTKRHKNVSVEVMGYSPVPLEAILDGCLYKARQADTKDFK